MYICIYIYIQRVAAKQNHSRTLKKTIPGFNTKRNVFYMFALVKPCKSIEYHWFCNNLQLGNKEEQTTATDHSATAAAEAATITATAAAAATITLPWRQWQRDNTRSNSNRNKYDSRSDN